MLLLITLVIADRNTTTSSKYQFPLPPAPCPTPAGAAVPGQGEEGGHCQGEDVPGSEPGLPPLLGAPLPRHPGKLAVDL